MSAAAEASSLEGSAAGAADGAASSSTVINGDGGRSTVGEELRSASTVTSFFGFRDETWPPPFRGVEPRWLGGGDSPSLSELLPAPSFGRFFSPSACCAFVLVVREAFVSGMMVMGASPIFWLSPPWAPMFRETTSSLQ